MKPRIVFFGTPDFVLPILSSLTKHFSVVGVVTSPDAISGRKKLSAASPVKQFTQEKLSATPILTPEKLDQKAQEDLTRLTPDLFIVAAYGKIIPQEILLIPPHGSLNIHPSLLPKYRGTSPIQTMLLQGDTKSGVTIIQVDAQMDHGPIVAQWEIPITKTATFASLHVSIFQDAADRLPEIINNYLAGKSKPIPQDESRATYCERITRESGYVDAHNPPTPEKLDRMTRAYYPWPTAWTLLRLNALEGQAKEKRVRFLPGKKIQVEGGKAVAVKDFLNGYPKMKDFIEKLLET